MMMEEKNVGGWTAILSLSLSLPPPFSLSCVVFWWANIAIFSEY